MRLILIFISLMNTINVFGQLYQIKLFNSYTQTEKIEKIKNRNEYYDMNFDLFFKGTRKRIQYFSRDTLFENNQFKRLTIFRETGGIEYDSLISDELCIVRRSTRMDSMEVFHQFENNILQKSDTFFFNKNLDLIEYRTKSLKVNYHYNNKGWMILRTEITPSFQTEENISYFSDSIISVKIFKSKPEHKIEKTFYYFNENDQIKKYSSYKLDQRYRPPNWEKSHSDTTINVFLFRYDGNQNLNWCEKSGCIHKIYYKHNKPIQTMTYSNGDSMPYESKTYEYLDKGLVKISYYQLNETEPFEMQFIKYKNKQIIQFITVNNRFQFEQRNIINFDLKERILTSYKIISERPESTYCEKIEYVDY